MALGIVPKFLKTDLDAMPDMNVPPEWAVEYARRVLDGEARERSVAAAIYRAYYRGYEKYPPPGMPSDDPRP